MTFMSVLHRGEILHCPASASSLQQFNPVYHGIFCTCLCSVYHTVSLTFLQLKRNSHLMSFIYKVLLLKLPNYLASPSLSNLNAIHNPVTNQAKISLMCALMLAGLGSGTMHLINEMNHKMHLNSSPTSPLEILQLYNLRFLKLYKNSFYLPSFLFFVVVLFLFAVLVSVSCSHVSPVNRRTTRNCLNKKDKNK